jgi:hypothetical protein
MVIRDVRELAETIQALNRDNQQMLKGVIAGIQMAQAPEESIEEPRPNA